MKVIYSSVIPFKGYAAITLFGVIFIRKELESKYNPNTSKFKYLYNHESIHEAQAIDLGFGINKYLGYCIFYILYLMECLLRLILKIFIPKSKPYKSLTAEVEAYKYEKDLEYLNNRLIFSQFKQKLII